MIPQRFAELSDGDRVAVWIPYRATGVWCRGIVQWESYVDRYKWRDTRLAIRLIDGTRYLRPRLWQLQVGEDIDLAKGDPR